MAARYEDFLAAGTRIVAIDVDSPGQHAAMVEKLDLPFPFLSDPDRAGAVTPYGLVNPDDRRGLAYVKLVEHRRWAGGGLAMLGVLGLLIGAALRFVVARHRQFGSLAAVVGGGLAVAGVLIFSS